MSMVMLDAERQETLLELANELARQLGQARVPRLGKDGGETVGISKSAISVVASFLGVERDLKKLGVFLEQLQQLDQRSSQNARNPKAEYRVLRDELKGFLAKQAEMVAEEILFVLRWAGRLVDFYAPREKKAGRSGMDDNRESQKSEAKKGGQREGKQQGNGGFGGTMKAELQRALQQKKIG